MPTPGEFHVFFLSLQVAAIGTIIGLPIAMAISWILAKTEFRGKFLLEIFVSFPLVLPPVVTGYVLLIMFRENSPIGYVLNKLGVDLIFTWVAAALAAGLVSLPLMVRSIEGAFGNVDSRLENVARSLGIGPWKTFIAVTIPLASRGILAGILLAFARGLGEFGATIVVAGNIPGQTQTLPLAIYTSFQIGDDSAAIRYIGFSIGLALLALAVHYRLIKRVRV